MTYDRQKYLNAVKSNVEDNIFRHSLALEACLGGIYDYLKSTNRLTENDSRDDWTLAALIHDIDFGGDTKEDHPNKTKEALAKYGLEISDLVDDLVKDHDGRRGPARSLGGWAMQSADSLTGLIMAVAYVYPDRKLSSVKLSSVLKRFLKEPKFASGTRRAEVALCADADKLNIPLEKFIEISLLSMQQISADLGL
jgi:predicted hydrolase (HD superfamily)